MMKKILLVLSAVVFFFTGILSAAAEDVPLISKEELRANLGSPALVILDVRARSQWETSQYKIPRARWVPKDQIDLWAGSLPRNKTIAVYCACSGLGASGRVTRGLLARGFTRARALNGGWKEWLASGYPLEERR